MASIIFTPLLWFPCRPKPDDRYAAIARALGEALLPLLLLHVAGALFTSWRHKENLLAGMLQGCKPVAGPDDVS